MLSCLFFNLYPPQGGGDNVNYRLSNQAVKVCFANGKMFCKETPDTPGAKMVKNVQKRI